MTAYDNIPDELQERDQWLLWDSSADAPRRPHWNGNFSVSWSDPDAWHSFDDAVELAETRESWGVGYVFAGGIADHPRGIYGGLDLDGCVEERGTPKDWLPSLSRFVDQNAYMEYSPSGEGIHIPIVGLELPDWWKDVAIDEHEGVEAYEKKFFTFTGDTLDAAGDEVAEMGDWVKHWLQDVYAEVDGETPWLEHEGGDRETTTPDTDAGTGSAEEIARTIDKLDARDVAEETIVDEWNDDVQASGNNRAFYPTWGGSDCNGRANIVDEDGWTDTGTYSGSGGPVEMAAIDMDEIEHNNAEWGAVTGKDWFGAVDHLRDLGFSIPEPEGNAPRGQTDGGAAAVQSGADTPEVDGPELTPNSVISEAGYQSGESELSDLNNNEIAFAVSSLIRRNDDYHVRWVSDNSTIYAYDDGVWKPVGDRKVREICHFALRNRNSQRLFGEVKHDIKSDPLLRIDRDELGAPEGTVAAENGLLDLRDRELQDLKPEHFALSRVPTAFDPGADYENTEWMNFLKDVVRDGDLKKLQEYAGYALWHHAQPYGKALFLVGPTDSGKGTFLKAIESVLGRDNVASQSLYELMQTRWGTAELYGKMANIRNEITMGGLKNVERFKEFTGGGDRVSAERKGKDPFQFEVTQKFIFATNQVPSVEHAGEPFFNRLLFVKFPDTVPKEEQDPQLAKRLKEESSAILNWMLDGLNRLLDNDGQFSNEKGVDDKREIADAFGSVTDRFAHNFIEATGDPDHLVHKGQLYNLFGEYADYLGKEQVPQQTFTGEIKSIGGVNDGQSSKVDDPDTDRPRVFTGLKIDEEVVREIGGTMPNTGDRENGPRQQSL